MAGIYIHIPFCKQACNYCNFYFSTSLQHKNEVLSAILLEIKERKHYLGGEKIDTVYFGGGTPSILSGDEIKLIFETIYSQYDVINDAEITIEANPDDLTASKLKTFKATPINRFSIGIQSFFDSDLRYMNRAHTAAEGFDCIARAQDSGFENISIDLIYGTPTLSNEDWLSNLNKSVEVAVSHISAYALTVETNTPLATLIRKKVLAPINENNTSEQFLTMVSFLNDHAFEQYEISNFCIDQQYARHNSAYWKGVPYLGIGPSAHSYNGESRSWNVSSNMTYVKDVLSGKCHFTTEVLAPHDILNETIMTGLRTKWGVDLKSIELAYGASILEEMYYNLQENALPNWYQIENNILTLTKEGRLFADKIASDLFFDMSEDGELFSI
jgi:oxygen-independent coproporphyrinogen III oxidase